MVCDTLRDDQWERIKGFLPGGTKGKRGPRTDSRRFLDALLWMARSGGRWRDLPERLGRYQSVKRRYYRWIEMGVLDDMLAGSFARSRSGMAGDRFDDCAGTSAWRWRAQRKRGRMPRTWAGLEAA
jgi:transposase